MLKINHRRLFKWSGFAIPSLFLSLAIPVSAAVSAFSLADLSIEQLMSLPVTSVSKKAQNPNDAAAVIAVLTADDLHRSGSTSLADALRLVPGMQVGQINSSQWSISSRGFSGQYANKLLVMVDGRTVYTPTLAGVYWDLQQPMLEDLERVEVIRGPGGTLWGANAVNGVINVVSKSARDTQGGLLFAGGGNVHLTTDGVRYGGKIGENTYYRVFGSYQLADAYQGADGDPAEDGWSSGAGGFRIDHYQGEDSHFTWQGDATAVEIDDHDSEGYNANTLARWSRELSERSGVEVQAYYDRTYRNEILRARPTVDTFDLAAHHTFGVGQRHDVIWGLGYRFIGHDTEETTPVVQVRREHLNLQVFSGFIQDEFKLIPDKLTLSAGTKVEHNDFTGFEIQPSVRAVFKPAPNQTVWAAVSRAVRTPNVLEGSDTFGVQVGSPFTGPGGTYVPRIVSGDPDSEILWSYELGYRIQPAGQIHVDAALFYNNYDRIININNGITALVPGTPAGVAEVPLVNAQNGTTYGGEIALTLEPLDHWRLTASYSLLLADLRGEVPPDAVIYDDPQQQVVLRSAHDFGKASFDAQVRAVDQAGSIPAYITADMRLAYRLRENLEVSITGQNLLDAGHREASRFFATTNGVVPRGVYGRVIWKF